MAKIKASKTDLRKPFQNSEAFIVSRKVLDEMIRKGEARELVNLLIKLLTLIFLFQILPPITMLILILIRIA